MKFQLKGQKIPKTFTNNFLRIYRKFMCHKFRQTQTTNRSKTLLRMPGIAWHYTEVVYLCLKLAMQTSFYIIQSHCYFVMV